MAPVRRATSSERAFARLLAALSASLIACGDGAEAESPGVAPRSPDETAGAAADAPADVAAASAEPREPATAPIDDPANFRAPWCDGPGQNPIDTVSLMYGIASAYDSARAQDCRTAGLLPTLSDERREHWRDYLIGYSTALAGCPPLPVAVPGGILAFGPANTPVIGLPQPRLGREDVEVIIGQYLAVFSTALGLTEPERNVVNAHLWNTADTVLDSDSTAVLSVCGDGE